jgi:[ribosomal protein S5]-alanine N-acetyltransferase
MPKLETNRLLYLPYSLKLKKATLQNRSLLAGLIVATVPDDWPGPDLMEALPFFIGLMEQDPSGDVWDGIIIHKQDNIVIGDMGFMGGPDASGVVEIGYSIIPAYRNQGYATEMARCLITWAFQQPGIRAVIAECLDDNAGSIKVLEKLGMRRLPPDGNMLKWEIRKEGWEQHEG